MKVIAFAILRHLAAAFGAIAAGSDEQIGAEFRKLIEQIGAGDTEAVAGTLIVLASVAWSIYDKRKKSEVKS